VAAAAVSQVDLPKFGSGRDADINAFATKAENGRPSRALPGFDESNVMGGRIPEPDEV